MMKYSLSVILLVALLSVNTNAQWKWQYPLPQGNSLTGVKVFNDGSVLAAGKLGTIIRSADNGKTWTTETINYTNDLNAMCFVDDHQGWIVGSSGLILKTTDGGYHWEKQDWGDTLSPDLMSVYFVNADTGWAGSSNIGGGYYGVLLKTVDGGKTWTSNSFYGSLEQIHFVNYKFGWVSSPYFQSFSLTKDGGKTWQKFTRQIDAVYFQDSLNGFYSYGSAVYKTTDGGAAWQKSFTLSSSSGINKFLFLDNKKGYAVGYQNFSAQKEILRTTDGGNSWIEDSNLTRGWLTAVDFNSTGTVGWTVGYTGGMVRTEDSGASWKEVSSQLVSAFNSIFFTDVNNGWAVGGSQGSDITGFVYHTTNGGIHWQRQYTDSSLSLKSVFFVSPFVGWAGGTKRIIKTTDGGNTWIQQSSSYVTSLFFLDEKNGWAVGSSQILNTDDGGKNWYLVNPGSSNAGYYNTVAFQNKQTGFIGGNGFILKTTDGGINWQKNSGSYGTVCSFSFADSLNGNAVSNEGAILKTSDNGNTWNILQSADYKNHFYSVCFKDPKHGIIAGAGEIFYSDDGGNNWIKGESPTASTINSVFFIDSTDGWMAGSTGIILKYGKRDSVTSVSGKSYEGINNFKLSQNYPNPFNPSTKIDYTVFLAGRVEIKVYDVLGRAIKTILNEFKSAGIYTVPVDLSGESSGVYYYSIRMHGVTKTKKMIYLK